MTGGLAARPFTKTQGEITKQQCVMYTLGKRRFAENGQMTTHIVGPKKKFAKKKRISLRRVGLEIRCDIKIGGGGIRA